MAKTYIFGHKSPDTDSVCSAIALAYLKNKQGIESEARVLGNINAESKFVLNYFNVDEPHYLNDVKIRMKDINYDKEAKIYEYECIDTAFKLMQKENITAIPLVDKNNVLTGYVTLKEIARYLINGDKENIDTTLDNIIKTLDATVVNKSEDKIIGNIMVAGMEKLTPSKEDILIIGDRVNVLNDAIDNYVKLIILTNSTKIDEELISKAKKNKVNVIISPYTSYVVASKILLSNYIKAININKTPVTFNNEDCYSDFKEMSHKVNHTNYPIVNNQNECLGLIRLTGPFDYQKYEVILVDHNNLAQSVDGIEEAEIKEIIDHHNLGAIGTSVPINFQSKPVGCTSTMICEMFEKENVEIPKNMAGLMLSAILSDTLLFTSPTTTEDDKKACEKLEKIAGVDSLKYGYEMLKAASSIKGMSIEEVITSDFKKFNIGDKVVGIGQVMTMEIESITKDMDKYVSKLNEMCKGEYDYIALFVTDIIKKGSYVLYNDTFKEIISLAFGIKDIELGYFIDGIVSRKKQILPNIMSTIEEQ